MRMYHTRSEPPNRFGRRHYRRTPSSQRFQHAAWTTLASIWLLLSTVARHFWEVTCWAFYCLLIMLPVLVLLILVTCFAYYGTQAIVLLQGALCAAPPFRFSIDQVGLDWCFPTQYKSRMPQQVFDRDPWSLGGLSELSYGLPHVNVVDELMTNIQRQHIMPLHIELEQLQSKEVLVKGSEILKLLSRIDTQIARGALSSRNFSIKAESLIRATKHQMQYHQDALQMRLKVAHPASRSMFSVWLHRWMNSIPFLASLDASHDLMAAINRVATWIIQEVEILITFADDAAFNIAGVEEGFARLDPLIADEVSSYKADCSVYFWQTKPAKCAVLGLYVHSALMIKFRSDIVTSRDVLVDIARKLREIRSSCEKSSEHARQIDFAVRSGWTVGDVLGVIQALILETGEYVRKTALWEKEYERIVDEQRKKRLTKQPKVLY